MQFETISVTLPEYAVCYLVNSDSSTLNDDDIQNIDSFVKTLPPSGSWDIGSEEPYFCAFPDFGLACNCYDAKYVYPLQESK